MPGKPPYKSLGQTIRLLRREKGWSQSDAASQLDISIPAFSKIETGITDINLSRLEQIARLFDIPLVQLIELDNAEIKPINNDELQEIQQRLSDRESEIILLQEKIISLFEELRDSQKREI
jgi:transcriptional regulator with XRE-family HTH domain